MIKSRHMYFVIATMTLGYVGDAAAATAPRLTPEPYGVWARQYNVEDSVGCLVCLQYDKTSYEGTESDYRDYVAEELYGYYDGVAYDTGDVICNSDLNAVKVYAWDTHSLPDEAGVYYLCTSDGWTKKNYLPNGTFNYNNGTITDGVQCEYMADGDQYVCASCSSVSCNDGYYGNPTDCAVGPGVCLPCPNSTYKKAIGGSGNFYTCTTQLQPGQSTAGSNRTISDCNIPKLVGGSGGAYCNDNGFFIWDSACSYAG